MVSVCFAFELFWSGGVFVRQSPRLAHALYCFPQCGFLSLFPTFSVCLSFCWRFIISPFDGFFLSRGAAPCIHALCFCQLVDFRLVARSVWRNVPKRSALLSVQRILLLTRFRANLKFFFAERLQDILRGLLNIAPSSLARVFCWPGAVWFCVPVIGSLCFIVLLVRGFVFIWSAGFLGLHGPFLSGWLLISGALGAIISP